MIDSRRARVTGPLVPFVDGFSAELVGQGYTSGVVGGQLTLLAHVSRWLAARDLAVRELTSARVEEFLESRRAEGYAKWLTPRGLVPLLGYLDSVGARPAPMAAIVGPGGELVEWYRRYLDVERGLTSKTIGEYVRVARVFLAEVVLDGRLGLGGLTAGAVTGFVVRECRHLHPGSAKQMVIGLRSLLRYLHVEGVTEVGLANAVPSVAGWGAASLPRGLDAVAVAALLDSCDRGTSVGRRDHAILTVLVRLGLRAGELSALCLDDVDWRSGEVVIRGKGGRRDRLPLPVDVGEALVAYLYDGRPRVQCRTLFLKVYAPLVGLSRSGVASVVKGACLRAGLPPVGVHCLRHTAASAMFKGGAGLAEIGEVLRHAKLSTTAIYAKVDRAALQPLARPWPGGAA